MRSPKNTRLAGFTLIEILIAFSLMVIVVVKISMVLDAASKANTKESAAMALEDQARRVLDQIAYAVLSADRDALFPDPESPQYTNEVEFMVSLGVDGNGNVVWSDPESIGLDVNGSKVLWRENPETPEERKVAWCNTVRPFLEGEIPNSLDDNGNGLADEQGLSFTLNKNACTIRLCLERQNKDGNPYIETVETVVTIRN